MSAVLVVLALPLTAQSYRDTIPQWLIPLRDALYEQVLPSAAALPIYNAAKNKAQSELSGAEQLSILSRCDYFMGRIYQLYKENDKALKCYQTGLDAAERSLDIKETAIGWEMRAANLSQMCMLKPKAWVMANGLNVEKFSKNALKLDSRNAPAQYMIASRWVYAPWPFNDTPKGIKMMKEILTGAYDLQKDDLFNAYVALAYAYLHDNNKSEALVWIAKALSIYPTNKYIGVELKSKCG